MANNTYSTPVINNFDAIKGDTNWVSGFSWLASFLLSV